MRPGCWHYFFLLNLNPRWSRYTFFAVLSGILVLSNAKNYFFFQLFSYKPTSLHYNVNHFINSIVILQISEHSFLGGKKNIEIFMLHLNFRLAETDFHKLPSHYHHVFKVFKYYFFCQYVWLYQTLCYFFYVSTTVEFQFYLKNYKSSVIYPIVVVIIAKDSQILPRNSIPCI